MSALRSGNPSSFIFQLLLLLLFLVVRARGQDAEGGAVEGMVVSTWNGSPLTSVVITVRGTTLATRTDPGGKYRLSGVPPGDQIVRFSKSGYATAVVTDVRVLTGQTTTVNGNLRPEYYEMEEYEVTAEEFNEQTVRILEDRKESANMMDAIGSDMFKNLAVGDAGEALSKVTGATVADGKYAVVRGLADRYTFTTMNGMDLPSADPDRKAFQLDLMPSKFIEKLDVRKTFTPDMSGGFAGGSIDIVSRSFPDDFLFEFRVGTAYNTQSSLRNDFAASDRSSTDWLAMDDGLRTLPDAAARVGPRSSTPVPAEVKGSFKSKQFAPVSINSPLDANMSMLIGDSQEVLGGMKLGYLAGMNYKNEYRLYDDGFVRTYDAGGRVTQIDKADTRGVIDYQWGALANLSLEINENHELMFNTMYIQTAEDEARHLVGQDGDVTRPGEPYADQSILRWTERNLTYFQLAGRHDFPELRDIRLDWGAAHSTTTQDDPDYRVFQFIAEPSRNFYNANYSSSKPDYPTRFWRELEENNDNLRVDLTVPLPSYNSRDNSFKSGVAYSGSKRDFSQRGFTLKARNNRDHPFFHDGDPNIWMADANLQYLDIRNFIANSTYHGEQTIEAGYLMGEWNALEWLEFIGGVRHESTDISIDSVNRSTGQPASGTIQQNDLLPSLTAIVRIRENLDLRAAWSQTVIRPTYREIAKVDIYDIAQNSTISGNPALEMSESENYDLRASWYPRQGEILSASVFMKQLHRPIELAAVRTDNTQITYENFGDADVFGFEGEVRLKLDRISELLEPFSIGLNGAYIQSEVPLTSIQISNRKGYGETTTTRPLYNQPSYILNGDLTWDNERTGTAITLSGGMVGESLVLVGLAKPDEYVQPAPQLNFFVRQKLGKHWDVRFTAKNLLNPAYEVTQTWPQVGEVPLRSHTRGITFGLSVGCEF